MKRKQLCAAILLMAVAVAVGSGGTGDQSVDHVQLNSTVGVQTKKKKVVKKPTAETEKKGNRTVFF